MERLTSDGLTACAMCVGEELGCRPVVASGRYAHEKWEKMQNCHNRKVYDRLREYEKTGLTPEQITAIQREIEAGELVRKPKIAPIMQDVIDMFGLEEKK